MATATAWTLLAPWSFDESVGTSTDESAFNIALIAGVITCLGLLLALRRSADREATWFTVGGQLAWVTTYCILASTAVVAGANLWMASLLFLVLPTAIASVVLVLVVDRRTSTRRHPKRQ